MKACVHTLLTSSCHLQLVTLGLPVTVCLCKSTPTSKQVFASFLNLVRSLHANQVKTAWPGDLLSNSEQTTPAVVGIANFVPCRQRRRLAQQLGRASPGARELAWLHRGWPLASAPVRSASLVREVSWKRLFAGCVLVLLAAEVIRSQLGRRTGLLSSRFLRSIMYFQLGGAQVWQASERASAQVAADGLAELVVCCGPHSSARATRSRNLASAAVRSASRSEL